MFYCAQCSVEGDNTWLKLNFFCILVGLPLLTSTVRHVHEYYLNMVDSIHWYDLLWDSEHVLGDLFTQLNDFMNENNFNLVVMILFSFSLLWTKPLTYGFDIKHLLVILFAPSIK